MLNIFMGFEVGNKYQICNPEGEQVSADPLLHLKATLLTRLCLHLVFHRSDSLPRSIKE